MMSKKYEKLGCLDVEIPKRYGYPKIFSLRIK